MLELLDIIMSLHQNTKRDYIKRMIDDKHECMKISQEYGKEYWDGDRKYGYGGYKYDGRWETVAKRLIDHYNLKKDANILDIGCGKGFLLYEFKKALPDAKVTGFDISKYALEHAKEEIKEDLSFHKAQDPYHFKSKEFDLAVSINTLHNLHIYELKTALQEIEKAGRNKYVVVESYRNEKELFNLQCWALTCKSFFKPEEWVFLFKEFGYTGDYEFIYFE